MRRLDIKETYRIDSEEAVKSFIEECKDTAANEGYEISAYSSKMKTKKSKGEIIDAGFEVVIVKHFTDFWEAD